MLIMVFIGLLTAHGICEKLGQYFQTDFILKTERIEIIENDPTCMDNITFKNFKYNRTTYSFNVSATWKVDIHEPVIAIFQGYKFASNEYRLFPVYFNFDICDALENNSFGLKNVYDCGNMFTCPIKKGAFDFCNWNFDYNQFPPHVPKGRYMYSVIWKNNHIRVVKYNIYVEIMDVPLPY